MHSQLDRPQPYNPELGEHQNAYNRGMVNEAPGPGAEERLIDDRESVISDSGTFEWLKNILTVYGFWAFCGGVYWGVGTIWGWFRDPNATPLGDVGDVTEMCAEVKCEACGLSHRPQYKVRVPKEPCRRRTP